MVLEDENRRRKDIDNATLEEAVAEIESAAMHPSAARSIVLAREGWHPGVIGIVASRLIERYYRPTVMITIENGQGKGSARAIAKFDIYQALRACQDLLLQFGGHKYAAGLTIAAENIPEFKRRFEAVCQEMIPEEDLIPKIKIESEISLDEITPDVVASLKRFAPFGPKNNRPNFFSRGLDVMDVPRIVGSNHLKFRAGQGGVSFEAIGFNLGAAHQSPGARRTAVRNGLRGGRERVQRPQVRATAHQGSAMTHDSRTLAARCCCWRWRRWRWAWAARKRRSGTWARRTSRTRRW